MSDRRTHRIVAGAAAGALATAPMTAVMLVARRIGLLGELPPRTIADASLDAVEVDAAPATRKGWTAITHVAFGGTMGALYGRYRAFRSPPARAAVEGALFGTAVWAASYAGWIPALGILPPPSKDRPGRPTTMILAHVVFGAALGLLLARRRVRSTR